MVVSGFRRGVDIVLLKEERQKVWSVEGKGVVQIWYPRRKNVYKV